MFLSVQRVVFRTRCFVFAIALYEYEAFRVAGDVPGKQRSPNFGYGAVTIVYNMKGQPLQRKAEY